MNDKLGRRSFLQSVAATPATASIASAAPKGAASSEVIPVRRFAKVGVKSMKTMKIE